MIHPRRMNIESEVKIKNDTPKDRNTYIYIHTYIYMNKYPYSSRLLPSFLRSCHKKSSLRLNMWTWSQFAKRLQEIGGFCCKKYNNRMGSNIPARLPMQTRGSFRKWYVKKRGTDGPEILEITRAFLFPSTWQGWPRRKRSSSNDQYAYFRSFFRSSLIISASSFIVSYSKSPASSLF